MARTSAEQMRAWQGPALLSFGFRPFFLFGAIWAFLAMILWLGALTGAIDLPTRFDHVSWHAHEFLFGCLGAVLAGFLRQRFPIGQDAFLWLAGGSPLFSRFGW